MRVSVNQWVRTPQNRPKLNGVGCFAKIRSSGRRLWLVIFAPIYDKDLSFPVYPSWRFVLNESQMETHLFLGWCFPMSIRKLKPVLGSNSSKKDTTRPGKRRKPTSGSDPLGFLVDPVAFGSLTVLAPASVQLPASWENHGTCISFPRPCAWLFHRKQMARIIFQGPCFKS